MSNTVRLKSIALLTILVVISVTSILLHRQNNLSLPNPKTPQEIRNMIKKLPDYQGDSLLIDDEGRITSLDGLIQSVLIQVYVVDANVEGIKNEVKATGLPEPYLVYKVGIGWYIAQYGAKSKPKPDSVKSSK
jgi:hypothetical protein